MHTHRETRRPGAAKQCALTLALLLLAPLSMAAPGPEGQHGPGERFAQFDTNGDGVVTRAEAAAEAASRRAAIDANGDGEISFEEMSTHRQARREQWARDRFAQLDSNGDGKVSVDELPDPGARMFDLLDADDDGRITREEIDRAREHRRHRGGAGRGPARGG